MVTYLICIERRLRRHIGDNARLLQPHITGGVIYGPAVRIRSCLREIRRGPSVVSVWCASEGQLSRGGFLVFRHFTALTWDRLIDWLTAKRYVTTATCCT